VSAKICGPQPLVQQTNSYMLYCNTILLTDWKKTFFLVFITYSENLCHFYQLHLSNSILSNMLLRDVICYFRHCTSWHND